MLTIRTRVTFAAAALLVAAAVAPARAALATLRTQSTKTTVSALGVHGQGSRNLVNMLLHVVKLAA